MVRLHTLLTVLGSQRASQSKHLMSWWSSSSHSWDDEWRGDRGSWSQQDWQQTPADKKDKDKDKEKDRFKNVTTLGATGKHPLTLEDRKSLLLALVSVLSPNKTVLSKIAVSTFTSTTTHALLFLLCRASPRMSIRLLRDEDGVFTINSAAQQLVETAQSFHNPQVG